MAEKAGLFNEYESNFILDEAKLRKIVNVIEEFSKKLESTTYILYTVSREDDSYYETREIEEVLTDDNIPGKNIRALGVELKEMFANKKEHELTESQQRPLVALSFTPSKSPKIRFGVTGEERDWCFLLTDELDNQIRRVLTKKPLLSFITLKNIDFIAFMFFVFIISLAVFFIARNSSVKLSTEEINKLTIEERSIKTLEILMEFKTAMNGLLIPTSTAFSLIVLFVIIEVRPIYKLCSKLCRSFFYWGDMIRVHDRYEKIAARIKWTIIVTFLLSLLASIIAAKLIN